MQRKPNSPRKRLKITGRDLLDLDLIDEIVPEPEGGAHLDEEEAARLMDPFLSRSLAELSAMPHIRIA